jgi:hypothetical protein
MENLATALIQLSPHVPIPIFSDDPNRDQKNIRAANGTGVTIRGHNDWFEVSPDQ